MGNKCCIINSECRFLCSRLKFYTNFSSNELFLIPLITTWLIYLWLYQPPVCDFGPRPHRPLLPLFPIPCAVTSRYIHQHLCGTEIRFPKLLYLLPISSSNPCCSDWFSFFFFFNIVPAFLSFHPSFLPSFLFPLSPPLSLSSPFLCPSFFLSFCFFEIRYLIAMSPNNSTSYVYNDFPVYELFSQISTYLIFSG